MREFVFIALGTSIFIISTNGVNHVREETQNVWGLHKIKTVNEPHSLYEQSLDDKVQCLLLWQNVCKPKW